MSEAGTEKQPPSERTRVKRYSWLATYDAETIKAILDAAHLGYVGCVMGGIPFVTPTMYWREGDRIYWHGSTQGRQFKALETQEICFTVSLFDGLVVARSAFNWNCNFRSVMILGKATLITDFEEKREKLRNLVNNLIPGQWERLRPATDKEIAATAIASLPIAEASCKLRVGPPEDNDADYDFPVWAGTIPIRQQALAPEPDPRNLPNVEMPADVLKFRIG